MQTILIEVARPGDADRALTVACVEYIVANNCLRQSRHRANAPTVAILTTDHPERCFQAFCQRASFPRACVIDGYSQWYPVEPLSSALDENSATKIHIAHHDHHQDDHGGHKNNNNYNDDNDIDNDNDNNDDVSVVVVSRLVEAIVKKFEYRLGVSSLGEYIVVLDSLSSVLRCAPGVRTFLQLRERLCSALMTRTSTTATADISLTLIATLHRTALAEMTCHALRTLAETHVRLFQAGGSDAAVRSTVYMDVRRRKSSGRVVFENVTARFDTHALRIVGADVKAGLRAAPSHRSRTVAEATKPDDLELAERGLTFRISLSSKEREMRAAAGLPYLHQDETLADSALELHPRILQIGPGSSYRGIRDGNEDHSDEEDDEDDHGLKDDDDDDEELFSEDV